MSKVFNGAMIALAVGRKRRICLAGWSCALAMILAADAARDAAAGVVLTARESKIEINGGANASKEIAPGEWDSGGEAYGPVHSQLPDPISSTDLSSPFSDSLSATATAPYPHFEASSDVGQESSLSFDPISGGLVGASGIGSAGASATNDPWPDTSGGADAMAESFFDIFFDVSGTPAPYTLTGIIDAYGGDAATFAEVKLLINTGEDEWNSISIYSASVDGADSSFLTVADTGSLALGSYWLHMHAFAVNPYPTGLSTSSFDVTLIVPEPSALILLGVGAIGLIAYVWRRRRS